MHKSNLQQKYPTQETNKNEGVINNTQNGLFENTNKIAKWLIWKSKMKREEDENKQQQE